MKSMSASSRRIIALDILRGYFILLIASIHLGYRPSLLSAIDGRGQLWVSEADAFFFISGLLVGLIRHRDIVKHGFEHAARKLWARGWKLYLVAVVLTSAYLIIGRLATDAGFNGAKGGLDTGQPLLHLLGQIISLQYIYGWSDFLAYYAAFMVIAPAALWLLWNRMWWSVAAVSALLWSWQWLGGPLEPLHSFLLWQAPFFMGVIIGYHWSELQSWFGGLGTRTRRWVSTSTMVAAATIFVAGWAAVIIPWDTQGKQVAGWFQPVVDGLTTLSLNPTYNHLLLNGRGGLLRPLLLLVFMAGAYSFVRRYEDRILQWFGWLLLPAGRNSLYVYIVEGALLFAIPFFIAQGGFWLNTALEFGIIAVVLIAIKRRFLFSVIPR